MCTYVGTRLVGCPLLRSIFHQKEKIVSFPASNVIQTHIVCYSLSIPSWAALRSVRSVQMIDVIREAGGCFDPSCVFATRTTLMIMLLTEKPNGSSWHPTTYPTSTRTPRLLFFVHVGPGG